MIEYVKTPLIYVVEAASSRFVKVNMIKSPSFNDLEIVVTSSIL